MLVGFLSIGMAALNMLNGLLDQLWCSDWVGAIPIHNQQVFISGQIGNLITTGGLHGLGDGDAITVVFNIKKMGQIIGGGNI